MGKVIRRGKEAREKALDIVRNGGTLEDAVNETGFGRDYIRQLCNKNNIVWKQPKKEKPYLKRERKKRETKFNHDEVRQLYLNGASSRELAKRFNTTKNYINNICRGLRPGNQYTNGTYDRIANAKRYIDERTPWFEFAGSFTGIDGYVDVKCKDCGNIERKSFVSIRHGRSNCTACKRKAEQIRKAHREEEQAKQRAYNKAQKERRKELAKNYVQMGMHACPVCGSLFVGSKTYCSDKCREQNKWHMKDGYRHLFPLAEVYKRDNGICHICGQLCDWEDKEERNGVIVYGNNYPSRDHVEPKSKGGKNEWANIRLAHRRCNSLKADSPYSKKTCKNLIDRGVNSIRTEVRARCNEQAKDK